MVPESTLYRSLVRVICDFIISHIYAVTEIHISPVVHTSTGRKGAECSIHLQLGVRFQD